MAVEIPLDRTPAVRSRRSPAYPETEIHRFSGSSQLPIEQQ
jgi:hypothetical protein